jgi:hypothetical protein
LWNHPYEDPKIEYYELNKDILVFLKDFIEAGLIKSESSNELEVARDYFPLLAVVSLSALSKEQRETVAGRYVVENGKKINIEFDSSFSVALY